MYLDNTEDDDQHGAVGLDAVLAPPQDLPPTPPLPEDSEAALVTGAVHLERYFNDPGCLRALLANKTHKAVTGHMQAAAETVARGQESAVGSLLSYVEGLPPST